MWLTSGASSAILFLGGLVSCFLCSGSGLNCAVGLWGIFRFIFFVEQVNDLFISFAWGVSENKWLNSVLDKR